MATTRTSSGFLVSRNRLLNRCLLLPLVRVRFKIVIWMLGRRMKNLVVQSVKNAQASGVRPQDFDPKEAARKAAMQAAGELSLSPVTNLVARFVAEIADSL